MYLGDTMKFAGGLIIGGAVLIGIGSIMPWQDITSGMFRKTIVGLDQLGGWALACAVVLLVVGILVLVKDSIVVRGTAVFVGLAALGVAAFSIYDILSRAADVEKLQRVQAALGGTSHASISSSVPGLGLYAVLLGAILAIIGSFVQNQQA